MTTETKPTVYEAWSKVMATVKAVAKTGHNKQQDYNFRGIDGVVNAAGPALREHGVIIWPGLLDVTYRDVEVGQKRTTMREVTVKVRYTIFGPAGDSLQVPDDPNFGVVPGESMDSGDKGTAKAMSVAYRIFLLQALSIPTHEPDPDSTSYERSARLPDDSLWAREAKTSVLAACGGDKVAAGAAWTAAGLDGRRKVTAAELELALSHIDEDTTEGAGADGPASDGDAGSDSEPTPATGPLDAASSDGATGHDGGRSVPEPAPTRQGEGSEPAPPGSGPDPAPAPTGFDEEAAYMAEHAAKGTK